MKKKPDALKYPLTWSYSNIVDDWGSTQTIFFCPVCGAVVCEPQLHAEWHKQAQFRPEGAAQ